MDREWEWRRAAVLWTPCGAGCGAAGVLWLLGYTRAASYLLTALCGGVLGVWLERVARGRFDLVWLLRHVLLPAALATLLVDREAAAP